MMHDYLLDALSTFAIQLSSSVPVCYQYLKDLPLKH